MKKSAPLLLRLRESFVFCEQPAPWKMSYLEESGGERPFTLS
jgi:hypothetical protein